MYVSSIPENADEYNPEIVDLAFEGVKDFAEEPEMKILVQTTGVATIGDMLNDVVGVDDVNEADGKFQGILDALYALGTCYDWYKLWTILEQETDPDLKSLGELVLASVPY